MLSALRLESILSALPRLTIGLMGDLFLDRYLELQLEGEVSIETGLEAYQVVNVRNSPGAVGTVMNNLAALGVGLLVPATVIGDDGHGYDLLREVRRLPVDMQHIICTPDRLTPTYTKPMRPQPSGEMRELNRLDIRTREPLSVTVQELLCERLEVVWRSSDGLIVLDQVNERNCGVVNDAVRDCLQQLSERNPGKLLYVDSRQRLRDFSFGVLKGNRSELAAAMNLDPTADVSLFEQAMMRLAGKTGRPVFCTLGEQGMLIADGGQCSLVPGIPVTGPIDVVGAGDSATSGIVSALLCGASPVEAAAFGNLIASITIQQLGTTGTASPDQIRQRWREMQ